jgi:hypothetical protein
MGGACSVYGREVRCIQAIGVETEGQRSLGRPRRRWEYNIKKDVQEFGCGGMDWIELAGTCECGNEPWRSTKCGEFLDYLRNCYLYEKDCAPWSK